MPDKTTIEKDVESEHIEGVLQRLSNETHKKIIKEYKGEDGRFKITRHPGSYTRL